MMSGGSDITQYTVRYLPNASEFSFRVGEVPVDACAHNIRRIDEERLLLQIVWISLSVWNF